MKLFMSMLFIGCIIGFSAAQSIIYVYPGIDQISYAIQFQAFPGDIIELAEGDYTETQTVIIALDLTIRGADGATVKWLSPDSADAISLRANLYLENIIFKTERKAQIQCIINEYGSVTPGEENTAEKNNLFIDHCQFIGYYRAIWTLPDADITPRPPTHPLDTLYVTNSLFYGGGNFDTYQAIRGEYRLIHYAKIEYCTFWNIEGETFKIYGFESPDGLTSINDYFDIVVDHCTFFDMGTSPIPTKNGVGAYVKYTDADDSIINCIFYDVSDFAIKASGGEFNSTYYDYNTADSCGWKPGCGVCQAWHYNLSNIGPNSQLADPLLMNPDNGDFRLKDGSPCLGSASDGSDRGNNRYTVWNPGTWDHNPTAVEDNLSFIPAEFELKQNYPNPFNPITTIIYSLPVSGYVHLDIYNIVGQKIRTLVNRFSHAGSHSVVWDGLDDQGNPVAAGLFFYRLHSGIKVFTKKMLLVK